MQQPEPAEHVLDHRPVVVAERFEPAAAGGAPELHRFADGRPAERDRFLDADPDEAGEGAARDVGDVPVVDGDRAGPDRHRAVTGAQQGRLAAAVGSDEGEYPARRHVEVHPVENDAFTQPGTDPGGAQAGHHSRP